MKDSSLAPLIVPKTRNGLKLFKRRDDVNGIGDRDVEYTDDEMDRANDRVVTRYIGLGIKGLESAGIQDHNARDRDQQCLSRDQQIFAGSGIKILGTNLGSVTKSIPRFDTEMNKDILECKKKAKELTPSQHHPCSHNGRRAILKL